MKASGTYLLRLFDKGIVTQTGIYPSTLSNEESIAKQSQLQLDVWCQPVMDLVPTLYGSGANP